MDIFGDKKFEELDWLTKTVEPMVYSINVHLEKMPDSMVLSFQDVKLVIDHWGMSLQGRAAFTYFLNTNGFSHLTTDDIIELHECFELKVSSEAVEIDFEKNEIRGGEITVEKIKTCFDEKELLERFLGARGLKTLQQMDRNEMNMDRLSEVLELMSSDSAMRKRTLSSKYAALVEAYSEAMKTNKWNIRNVDLANKAATWIKDYIETGNYASMVNFCKLKAQTHRNYPIYEIEEEV